MLKSMTGFSRTEERTGLCIVALEISSVNHRNQEISVRLPREISHLEPMIQQKLRSSSRRGKIQARVDISWDSAVKASRIEPEVLKGYAKEMQDIRVQLGMKGEVNLELLLPLPGAVSSQETAGSELEGVLKDAVETILDRGIEEWDSMRVKEGEHLQGAILDLMIQFGNITGVIEDKWSTAREKALSSVRERISRVLGAYAPAVDENRIAQEIVLISDKWDITEEIARSSSHVDKFLGLVHNDEVSGKTLDFLLQEMNREINTIASKVQDPEVRWAAVEAKGLLESIREQVQNVE